MLTASDAIADALKRAARRWPEDADRPARLLQRLIAVGDAAAASEDAAGLRARRAAIARTSGMFSGMYPAGYLEDLRQDWPE